LYAALADAVRQEMPDAVRTKRVDEILLRLFVERSLKPAHLFVLSSIGQIGRSGGNISVSALAGHTCIGERQLQRTYMEMIGVSPKTLCNITRYIRTRRYISSNPGLSIEGVAHENSYFDRSHLFREFKRFSGTGPV
jgi:AraC-like DNA-binding protein